jgi:hypothetical protein
MVNSSKLQIPEHRPYNWMCSDICSLPEFLFFHGETASIKSHIVDKNSIFVLLAHLRGETCSYCISFEQQQQQQQQQPIDQSIVRLIE